MLEWLGSLIVMLTHLWLMTAYLTSKLGSIRTYPLDPRRARVRCCRHLPHMELRTLPLNSRQHPQTTKLLISMKRTLVWTSVHEARKCTDSWQSVATKRSRRRRDSVSLTRATFKWTRRPLIRSRAGAVLRRYQKTSRRGPRASPRSNTLQRGAQSLRIHLYPDASRILI